MSLPIPNKLHQRLSDRPHQRHLDKSIQLLLDQLHRRLLELPFDAYLKLLSLLLTRLGYDNVQLAGRTDWKGRNKGGGYDLTATLPGGLYPRRIVIQAKQFDKDSRIFQRQADELRGAALRVGATEALLITSGSVSKSIDVSGLHLPVRIIGGEQLLDLLVLYRIGATPRGEFDESIFTQLEQEATGNRPADCTGAAFLVTLDLKRVTTRRRTPRNLS